MIEDYDNHWNDDTDKRVRFWLRSFLILIGICSVAILLIAWRGG